LQLSLKKLNFDVQVLKDGDLKEMGRAVKNFGLRAQDAQVALFYYSGHGIQARDENFLMPVGSKVESEADLDIEAMPLKALMRQIEDAHPKTTVVVLDACRDNPVAARFQTASKGLKLVGLKLVQNPPPNTLLVYASLPGTTATDNGVFAKELASQITQPNVGIRTVFDKVGMAVRAASGNRQNIQRDDQLSEDVVQLRKMPKTRRGRWPRAQIRRLPMTHSWWSTHAASTPVLPVSPRQPGVTASAAPATKPWPESLASGRATTVPPFS
jgi:uncharacterized caspase-like protein